LTFSNWAYFDRTQLLDNTNVKRYEASYDHPIGPQDITAQYSYLAVESAGAPSGHVQITSLADDVHVDSSTTASIALRQDTVNLPIVQNSYVRQQQSATATLSHAWENWYGTLAFQRRSAQEINSESTSVTTPQWQTVEANVNGDLGRGWRLIANGRAQNLWNAVPLSTAIPDTLLWSSRQYGQLRLNGVSDFVQGYLDWSYNRTANTSTGTVIQQEVYNAGGDWQASPMVDIYVDYTNDFWAAVDNEVGAPSLGGFAPSDRVLSIGANWIPTSRTSFSAGYSGYWTSNENPLGLPDASTTGGYLTLQVQQQLTHGRRFGVVVAPWAYRDEVASSMDYNATVLRVTLSTPF
jgi:hypothetical protein